MKCYRLSIHIYFYHTGVRWYQHRHQDMFRVTLLHESIHLTPSSFVYSSRTYRSVEGTTLVGPRSIWPQGRPASATTWYKQWRIVESRGPGARNSVGPSATFLNWESISLRKSPSGVWSRAPEAKHFGNNILKIG